MDNSQTIGILKPPAMIGAVTCKVPFTLLFLAIQIGANTLAGTLFGGLPVEALTRWGVSAYTIVEGEYFRLLTGIFLSQDPWMFLRQSLFVALVIGLFEVRFGTRNTILAYFAISIPGTLLALAVVAGPMNALFTDLDTAMIHDVGMSAGGFGLLAILLSETRYRRIFFAMSVIGLVAKGVIALDLIPDTIHLITFVMGWYCSQIMRAEGPNPKGQHAYINAMRSARSGSGNGR